ncbi:MAG TPA: HEAT repeat domain-containing protein [Ktedonobacteraceae bacterium]|nr:HEAT repeat domain-containing protein [Ktedonobacteraceae bacterium]
MYIILIRAWVIDGITHVSCVQINGAVCHLTWSKHIENRWNEIEYPLVTLLVREYSQKERAVPQDWRMVLSTVHQQPEEDVGHLGLILALRFLPDLSSLEMDELLADVASALVARWADLLIATARATRESYAEDPRLIRLRLLARFVRPLNPRLVQAGVVRLTSALLDPGEHERVRGHLIHTVGALGAHAPLQALFACLREHTIPLVGELERALQVLATQIPLEPVIVAVLDSQEDWKVREQAALLLGRSGKPEGVPVLVTVASGDDSCACDAIDALAMLGKEAPLEVLIEILRNDNSAGGWKRVHAARALGELGQASANEALIEVLRFAQEEARAEIVEALVKLHTTLSSEQLIAWLSSNQWSLQWLAIEKLSEQDQPVPAQPLLAILRKRVKHDDYDQHRLRASALRFLNQQRSLVPLPLLRRLLKENHWSLQDGLRQAFALHGDSAPLEMLRETLANEGHGRAIQALQTLEMLQQEVPIEPLLAHYAHGINGIDSRQAEWGRTLLQYGTRLPAETLMTIACECAGFREDDEDEDMVAALGKLGGYIVEALLAKLSAYSVIDFGFLPRVASAIYDALPEQNLLAALQKSEGDICMAAGILAVTGKDQYLPLLRSTLERLRERPVPYCKVLTELTRFRERFPLDLLLSALLHEHTGIRETAVHILSELNTVLDVSRLVIPLQTTILAYQHDPERDHYSWDARFLIEALGLCREYAPIAFLVSLLEDDQLSDEVGEALANLGEYVPFEVFFTMLRSPNQCVNEHALLGLGKQKERVPVDRLLTLLPCKGDTPERSRNEQGEPDQEEDEDEQYMIQLIINALLELEEYASPDILQDLLHHENGQVCISAQRALAELATKGIRERVIRSWLSHYDEQLVRQSAVEAYAALGEAVPLAFWLDALQGNEDENLAVGAACVLEQLARVIPETIAVLAPACHLPGMCRARLRAWSMLGELDKILSAAQSETHDDVRLCAIEILGEMQDSQAIAPLLQLLRDEDHSRLLLGVIEALSKLGNAVPPEPLLEICGYREYESQRWYFTDLEPGIEAATVLKQTHPDVFRSIVPLAEAMMRGEPPAGVFASRTRSQIADAVKGIGRSGPLTIAHLSESLDWPYWQVRMKAAQALGKVRRDIPTSTIRRLLELRHDPASRAVREAADEALAEILSLETGIEDD